MDRQSLWSGTGVVLNLVSWAGLAVQASQTVELAFPYSSYLLLFREPIAVDLDQILPKVFVGACPRTAEHIDWLKDNVGITAVLNVQTEEDFEYWGIDWDVLAAHYRHVGIEARRTPVRDFDVDALRRHLPQCVQALDDLLKDGHTVYVHCTAGINRSPSTVIAYLHWVEQWDWEKAIQQVTSHRQCDPYLDVIQAATEDRKQ